MLLLLNESGNSSLEPLLEGLLSQINTDIHQCWILFVFIISNVSGSHLRSVEWAECQIYFSRKGERKRASARRSVPQLTRSKIKGSWGEVESFILTENSQCFGR